MIDQIVAEETPMSDIASGSGESSAPIAPGGFTRNATGLVRQVSLVDQFLFNAASTTPLGMALVFGLFALVLFPRSNPYIALVVAIVLGFFVWVMFSLMSAAIPRIGGDYTFNTRVLHPWIGLAGNFSVFISTAIAMGLWSWWFGTQGLSPAFSVIGSVTNSKTFTDWGTSLDGHEKWLSFLIALIALAITSALAMRGTKTVVRVMTIMFLIATIGFLVDVLILLFTSPASFRSTVDSTFGAGTYQKTVDAGKSSGLYPSQGGYSTKETIGAIYSMIGVTLFVWWGTYMSAEFKGAGQRRRQLTTMVGAGLGQALLMLIGLYVFLSTVGYNFFVSALAGNFSHGPVGSAGYAYFSALVAGSTGVVAVLALVFVGWLLPGLYINQAMVQRGFFTWSFDRLAPNRFASVNDRTHTPVTAIVITFLFGAGAAAWVVWDNNFFKIFAIMQVFAYIPIVFVGLSALLMKHRRPDLYAGSAAQWRVLGIEVLPVVGALSILVGCFSLALVYYFHRNLGLLGGYYTATILAPVIVLVVAGIWFFGVRAFRLRQGIDISLTYKAIPPD
jgi:basic amino acid/polyamine antiporter, APA family